VTFRAIVVHQCLAQPVLPVPLQVGFELRGRPPPAQPVSGLWILGQPIDQPLKVQLLGQVDAMRQRGLHLLLQELQCLKPLKYLCPIFGHQTLWSPWSS
jgi:hypothetical protein